MKTCLVFFSSVILSVSCIQLYTIEQMIKNNFTGIWREKRQEEEWNWGHVAVTESNRTSNDLRAAPAPSVNKTETNPCDPVDYEKPNFSATGRRISETKCYEYIWEVKKREMEDHRLRECTNDRIKNADPNGPQYTVGGRNTEPGEFPQMGAIGWKAVIGTWIFKCGSSLISPKYVLTAAHCSVASSKDTTIADVTPQIVRLGDKNIIDEFLSGRPKRDEKIIKIIVHPEYKAPKKYYDIALMELENEVAFTKYIQPGCLWSKADITALGNKGTLTGWGVVETAGKTTSPELQAAVVDIIDSTTCDNLLRTSCNRHWCGIQDHQLCAGKLTGGVDACQGDSGGPLQVKIPLPITTQGNMNFIFGVTSFGVGCALENLPGIYTRVSSFIDWIENIVWK